MFCTKCGKEIKDGQMFCTNCGQKVNLKNNNEDIAQESLMNQAEITNNNLNKSEVKNAEKFQINCGARLASVFRITDDEIELSQYKYTVNNNPYKIFKFRKSIILGCKFKLGISPYIGCKIRTVVFILSLLISLIFPPAFAFSLPYGFILWFYGDVQKYLQVSLKTGEKIQIFYANKEEARYIISLLVE